MILQPSVAHMEEELVPLSLLTHFYVKIASLAQLAIQAAQLTLQPGLPRPTQLQILVFKLISARFPSVLEESRCAT